MSQFVYYWRGKGEERSDLIRVLKYYGYEIKFFRVLEDITDQLSRVSPYALVVDASAGDAEVSQRIIELEHASPLWPIPTLFMGRNASDRTAGVARNFKVFLGADIPFRLQEVLSRFLEAIEENLGVKDAALEDSGAKAFSAADPSLQKAGFKDLLFLSSSSESDFDIGDLFSRHPKGREMESVLQEISIKNNLAAFHARRSAFTSAAVARKLHADTSNQLVIGVSSLFFNWASIDEEPASFSLDLVGSASPEKFRQVADGVRMSAERVSSEFGEHSAAGLLSEVADHLVDLGNAEKKLSVDSQTVLVGELVQRACFKKGQWQHAAVPRVLRHLRRRILVPDPHICVSAARFLGESAYIDTNSSSVRYIGSLTSKAAKNAGKGHSQKAGAPTRSVKLYELEENLRLAEPLRSTEGAVVCPAEVILDFDVIMRIFQLSAFLPLQGSVLVYGDR